MVAPGAVVGVSAYSLRLLHEGAEGGCCVPRESVCVECDSDDDQHTHTLDTQQQSQRDRSLWEGSRQTSPSPSQGLSMCMPAWVSPCSIILIDGRRISQFMLDQKKTFRFASILDTVFVEGRGRLRARG